MFSLKISFFFFVCFLSAPSGESLKSSSDKNLSDKSSSDKGSSDKGSSDEMDTSRTQRRFNLYINSVKEFLSYFRNKNNLLTVDTSCGDVTSVWDSVCNYVVDSEISKPKGLTFLFFFIYIFFLYFEKFSIFHFKG